MDDTRRVVGSVIVGAGLLACGDSSNVGNGGAGAGAAVVGGAGGAPTTSTMMVETTTSASSTGSAGATTGSGGEGGSGSGCIEISTAYFGFTRANGAAIYAAVLLPNQGAAEVDVVGAQLYGAPSGMPGTYDLSNGGDANYQTCTHCILASVDPSGTFHDFYQSSGTLVIEAGSQALQGEVQATLTDVTLIEVTIDLDTFVSTPVPGGLCLHIESADVDRAVPTTWTCEADVYQGFDGCDCGCDEVDPDCFGNASASACTYCPSGSCANDGSDLGCEASFLDPANNGACVCSCAGLECGDDGCGQSCGSCSGPESCVDGQCSCTPDCNGKSCGGDGCLGSCGTCAGSDVCAGGSCCTPSCAGKECGGDGCNGSCGTCASNESCVAGQCQCVPSCFGKTCGSDGCVGSCGTCSGSQVCNAGNCCTPNCAGKVCGSNGCGGSCGSCGPGQTCTASQQCCTTGGSCNSDFDCCNAQICNILNDTCVVCIPNGGFPGGDPSRCCSGHEYAGNCVACVPAGGGCDFGTECCSGTCSSGVFCL